MKIVKKYGNAAEKLGNGDKPQRLTNKPELGHVTKANATPKRFVKEIAGEEMQIFEVGQEVKANIFTEGELVDVTGTSKGKGFQGVIKRHNFSRGPMAHGSGYHRGTGAMSDINSARIKKGRKMPGR